MYLKKLSKNINFNSKIVKAKIIEVKGSSPNSLDDIILISTDTIFGTIGGGNLEYLVIDEAKKLIDNNIANKVMNIPLGPGIGQCCGGYVQVKLSLHNNTKDALKDEYIVNNVKIGAKLLSRHWIIEDANGKVQDVKGEGVVGDQPYINTGGEYQYTSGTVLETSLGTMKGTYQMITDSENYFDAEIPEFVLTIPRVIH